MSVECCKQGANPSLVPIRENIGVGGPVRVSPSELCPYPSESMTPAEHAAWVEQMFEKVLNGAYGSPVGFGGLDSLSKLLESLLKRITDLENDGS